MGSLNSQHRASRRSPLTASCPHARGLRDELLKKILASALRARSYWQPLASSTRAMMPVFEKARERARGLGDVLLTPQEFPDPFRIFVDVPDHGKVSDSYP